MACTLKELSERFGVSFSGNGELVLTHACGVDNLSPGGIGYITDLKGLASVPLPSGTGTVKKVSSGIEDIKANQVAMVVYPEVQSSSHNLVFYKDPLALHVQITNYLHPRPVPEQTTHPTAVVGKNVVLGKDITLDANVVLYDNVRIGDNTTLRAGVVVMPDTNIGKDCILYPNVVIREKCNIGDRVIIHPGAVIGADGFGFFQRDGINLKIPQVGEVIIEDDVEIGACSTIDRGRLEKTIVRQGSKIDNQVQIAHNVEVGAHSLISGQSAIGGSTKIGHHLVLGGQSGIRDNIKVGNNVTVAARGAVSTTTKNNAVLGGSPAIDFEKWRRNVALLNSLESLHERVKQLEELLSSPK
jgi:UDP-3-O-[3-hydroxymyristoyl] glucosamine N-acyltransferase